ncbi:lysine--tRNA ligase [Pseudonocardia endophytica]|uniref:lysine--tRNA ligase n=1 Tax=Pseudonocardia endophytica TaxID=401976 RepID=UPI00104D8083|nr:lysine--tRNA ligase [Pseudonocardia endophytica]
MTDEVATHADDQRERRLHKLEARRAEGTDSYPYRFDTDHTLAGLREAHGDLGPDERTTGRVRVAGRLELIRRQGGLSFGRLRDRTGALQLFVDSRECGADEHRRFDDLDRGDWVGVEGTVMTTKRGELSIAVEHAVLLGKALAEPPDKHRGLGDVETRYRQRYLDLEVNERTREIFRIRHTAIRAIRHHLEERGFTEVEGPVLGTIQGGASARPFITHHNALDIDLYLRIALELHLKRLIVGGLERVFEIGRVFRNEGIDTRHNPEFTMLEAYQAFADYHDMMDLVEGMVVAAARSALNKPEGPLVVHYGGHDLDLAATPWPRERFADMIANTTGERMHPGMPVADARSALDRLGLAYEQSWGPGRMMKEVYDERVQHDVVGPVFCIDYPTEVSPLARVHRDDPDYVERFELIVAGFELCNAYSEQNDPVAQLAAFTEEAKAKAGGDPEAGDIDLDYVRALEQGMPCTGGLGIGIDRLVMLLASVDSIREVVLFPTLRPEFTPPDGGPRGAPRAVVPPTPLPADGIPAQPLAMPSPAEPAHAGAGATSSRAPAAAVTGSAAVTGGAVAGGAGVATGGVVAAGGGAGTVAPLRSGDAVAPPPPVEPEHRGVRIVAWLTALSGLLQLISTLPVVHARLGPTEGALGPLWVPVAGHVASVLIGLLLILLADQLRRRKRLAWRVAVVLFALGLVLHLLKGPHPVAALIAAGLLVTLILLREQFRAPADPPSLLRLFRFVPIYLIAVIVFGVVALFLERGRISPDLSLGGALGTVFAGLIGLDGPYTYASPFFDEFFPAALLGLGILGVAVLVILIFRPIAQASPHTGDDWAHAERLVHTYGWDTLAYFALRDDKSFFFSRDGEAMIAYTYLGGYALVSGDPIGRPESVPVVLDEFLAMCDERAWHPALLAAREQSMPLYASRGFSAFYLGDEAIIDCRAFTLEGPEHKSLRAAVRRVGRSYSFRLVSEANASTTLVGQLNAISARWRGKAPERGFTMSLSQDIAGAGENPEFLLCVAVDADGVPGGFLRLVPAYGTSFGYTLDLMRHDPGAPNGMTEFLIASTAAALSDRGVSRLSMNFAMWGRLFADDVPFTPAQRLAQRAVRVLNPFFQIESLRAFNERFDPRWLPRVLAYRHRRDLPRVGLLYAGAEGFLAVPGLGELLVPRAVGGVTSPSAPDTVRDAAA